MMFTGIIQQTSKLQSIAKKAGLTTLTIVAPKIASNAKIGDSIAIDGTCLTITSSTKKDFTVEAMPETIDKTIVKNYKVGAEVNLESPLKMGDSVHGHFISGHVDFIGTIHEISVLAGKTKVLAIIFPQGFSKFFAIKGSVTINGVSLTISKLEYEYFEVSLIPQTLKTTNLNTLKKGSQVNIEVDLFARYLDRLLKDKAEQTTYDFLQERGFI